MVSEIIKANSGRRCCRRPTYRGSLWLQPPDIRVSKPVRWCMQPLHRSGGLWNRPVRSLELVAFVGGALDQQLICSDGSNDLSELLAQVEQIAPMTLHVEYLPHPTLRMHLRVTSQCSAISGSMHDAQPL